MINFFSCLFSFLCSSGISNNHVEEASNEEAFMKIHLWIISPRYYFFFFSIHCGLIADHLSNIKLISMNEWLQWNGQQHQQQ